MTSVLTKFENYGGFGGDVEMMDERCMPAGFRAVMDIAKWGKECAIMLKDQNGSDKTLSEQLHSLSFVASWDRVIEFLGTYADTHTPPIVMLEDAERFFLAASAVKGQSDFSMQVAMTAIDDVHLMQEMFFGDGTYVDARV